ncbi:MAG: SRPBCC family protein [Actinomycetes bacterium]
MDDGGGAPLVRFAATYWFPVAPEQMWDILKHFDRYPGWWAWLHDLNVVPDGTGLVDGTRLSGVVVPPVPYRLSLRVTLDRCVRPARVEATIDGDVRGRAVLQLAAAGGGTLVTAAWTLRPASTALRVAARVAGPLARWGHNQVVAMAVAGFRRRALDSMVGEPGRG